MNKIIQPSLLKGTVQIPPSKSAVHRALVCASFADRETLVRGAGDSDDIRATAGGLSVLGAKILRDGNDLIVTPVDRSGSDVPGTADDMFSMPRQQEFDCGESGTTLRFIFPLIGIEGSPVTIKVRGRLSERPNGDLIRELTRNGMAIDQYGCKFDVLGKIRAGQFRLPGNVSSQFISGLLMALPMIDGESTITIEGELSSSGYVGMTLDVMRAFGIEVGKTENGYVITHAASYISPGTYDIEGDCSSAAFWIAANALGADIVIKGLNPESGQPDAAASELISRIRKGGSVIDIDQTPDLLPILAVTAASAEGETHFVNASRLRMKESDRIDTVMAMINALGGHAEAESDKLTVYGNSGPLPGGTVDSHGDHRIAMSAAVSACCSSGPVIVKNAGAVAKSYPSFWKDLEALGATVSDQM